MQMRMMYGTKAHLDQCEFCPGAVYFITDTCEIYFDAPDREERIRMTINPDALELESACITSRVSQLENQTNSTENYLQELSSLSFPNYTPNRW